MADTPTKDEVLALERDFWQSMVTKDPTVAMRLTGNTSIIVGAQGTATITKQQIGGMLQAGQWKLLKFEFSNIQFNALDADTAILAYAVKEEMEVDGKPLTLEANDSSVWSRRTGSWECVLHTESIKGDSFGRDRVQK